MLNEYLLMLTKIIYVPYIKRFLISHVAKIYAEIIFLLFYYFRYSLQGNKTFISIGMETSSK